MKMKSGFVLYFLVALTAAYDSSHDDFDIDGLVKNTDALKKFNNCFVHDTDCDDNSSHFKKDIPEAYQQACAKCNQVQKHILKKYIQALKEKLPEQYQEFKNHYDPEGKYTLPLETAIATA